MLYALASKACSRKNGEESIKTAANVLYNFASFLSVKISLESRYPKNGIAIAINKDRNLTEKTESEK
ncbi:MAG: hypothetical protein BroJett025_06210 [Patescibacteria group bacterium]|nr:MAG: hypothetical protein BroJett025_06210 [Patescibacteria group bacterium]